MRRPLLSKKKPEQEQASPFFKKKHDDQFFPSQSVQAQEGEGADKVTSLSEGTQSEMGAALGGDFSDVKIHTGPEAKKMSDKMNARAFTYGKDIYFNQNMFDEHTRQGKMLLAHELVHTMQQQTDKTAGVSNEMGLENNANNYLENAAAEASTGSEKSSSYKSTKSKSLATTGLQIQRCAPAPDNEPNLYEWKTQIGKDQDGSGWKRRLTYAGFLAANPPRNVLCNLLVGVPGWADDNVATAALVTATTKAAEVVNFELNSTDPSHSLPSSTICKMFKDQVQAHMQTAIPRSEVQQWNH